VWSLDDTMNEHSELSSIFCQVHHSWQLCTYIQLKTKIGHVTLTTPTQQQLIVHKLVLAVVVYSLIHRCNYIFSLFTYPVIHLCKAVVSC